MSTRLSSQSNNESTGRIITQPTFTLTQSTAAQVTHESATLRREVGHLRESAEEIHQKALQSHLSERKQQWGRKSADELLHSLRDWGFAWRDVARVLDVSVPALQKWRKGTSNPTGANRLKLASMVAVIDYVETEWLVNDPASWFEMPIRNGVHVTPLDLLASEQEILVLEFASEQAPSERILDIFEPEWREKFVDSAFEVFTAHDGTKAIRPKV